MLLIRLKSDGKQRKNEHSYFQETGKKEKVDKREITKIWPKRENIDSMQSLKNKKAVKKLSDY